MVKKRKSEDETQQLLDSIVFGMQEVKAMNITLLDLRKIKNSVADYFVICEGNSSTQVQAIENSIDKQTSEILGVSPFHVEGVKNGTWVLMDYFSVVVHVFDPKTRAYYDLEDLWADAGITQIEEMVKINK